MEQIKKKVEELNKLLSDYKPKADEQQKIRLLRNYVALAFNVSSYQSRVTPGTEVQQEEQPKPKKGKRGRPKKKAENVLAQSGKLKTLTEKLAKDAKK